LENIERTWSRHCYGQGHCVTPLSNIAVLATNVIKMTEWPAYKMARDLANGKVFPVSETVIMQTACKHGIGPDGEAVAGGLKQSAPLDFVLERLALGLGTLQGGVGVAERIGERGVREIVESGCGRQIGSLGHGLLHRLGLGPVAKFALPTGLHI
jgi:hypothetical protein